MVDYGDFRKTYEKKGIEGLEKEIGRWLKEGSLEIKKDILGLWLNNNRFQPIFPLYIL